MKETEFTIRPGPEDRLREYHARTRGKIISFAVQYGTFWKGKWMVVVRYDTAHGFSHRDQYDVRGTVIKTPLFVLNYNQALTPIRKKERAQQDSLHRHQAIQWSVDPPIGE